MLKHLVEHVLVATARSGGDSALSLAMWQQLRRSLKGGRQVGGLVESVWRTT